MAHSATAALPVGKLPGDILARLISTYVADDPSVLVGPGLGYDAAAVAVSGHALVVKSDPITFATEDAPRYLVNVNANDLACLGAVPRWLVVTALFPEHGTTEAIVEAHFRQLCEVCAEQDITLIGGHTEITAGLTRPILAGQMLGDVADGQLLRPGGAKSGDVLLLTKALAIEGTALLARELRPTLSEALDHELVARAAELLHKPGMSVVRDARVLREAGGIRALHDPTEGGLATGVRELAEAAGCGAVIDGDAVPILAETAVIAAHLGLDPLGMLASGSLLAAAAPASVAALIAAGAASGIAVTEIGTITSDADRFVITTDGNRRPLPSFARDEVTRVLP